MKANTLMKAKFTGEYWDYTSAQDPLTLQFVNTYFKADDLRFSLVPAEKGTLYLYSETQLRVNSQIRELKDSDGKYLYTDAVTGEPSIAYVSVSEPVLDVWGTVIGYRHDLSQEV